MYKNQNVIVVTPAGRKEYLEILEPYIVANRPLVDRWVLWVNTPHNDDILYIKRIRDRNPGFVELVYSETPIEKGKPRPQSQFFKTTVSRNTVYVKFDDDICWVAPDAIEKLVEFRLKNREPFFVMANVVMNGMTAYIHQKYGAQKFLIDDEYQRVPPESLNKVWSEVKYCEYIHRNFIRDLVDGDLKKYLFESWTLDSFQRVSINCIAWRGEDFAEFGGVIPHYDEEDWMCTVKAKELNRPNVICGQSLVAHHAFYKHRPPFVRGKEVDKRILQAYKAIQKKADRASVIRILTAKTMI